MENFLLPIGINSQQTQDSRNKDNKEYRLYHSRKETRKHKIKDKANYLFASRDPSISSISQKYCSKKMKKNSQLKQDI